MPIAITFVKYVFTSGRQGAPLDYVRLDRMLGDCHFAVLNNKAPHPNAGKAFLDYYLDDEGMKILAEKWRICEPERDLSAFAGCGTSPLRADGKSRCQGL